MLHKTVHGLLACAVACLLSVATLAVSVSSAQAAEPIKIGFSMSLTGGLSLNGKQSLLAMKIWEEDINSKGGLLDRPVKLVYYDDQSNPANVPAIYTKLLDVEKVDLVASPQGTSLIVPALPIIMEHKMVLVGIFGIDVNRNFHYSRYFAMNPTGPEPSKSMSEGFFRVAADLEPKPNTVAIAGADTFFTRFTADGARANAEAAGMNVVYNKAYPPPTTDFAPIIRAIQATNPDIVYVAAYPPDTVGMVRAAHELGLKAKVFGGAMFGLSSASIKTSLGPLLNGIINFEFWVPIPALQFPGVMDLVRKYEARAPGEGTDPIDYTGAPFTYSALQVLAEAVGATHSLDHEKLAAYIHSHASKTVVGDISFNGDGEWDKSRVLMMQFHDVKPSDKAQFSGTNAEAVVWPDEYRTTKTIIPYDAAAH